jgi:murein DD-endopeptidase MepM/ murein hydrolase activator NlpD
MVRVLSTACVVGILVLVGTQVPARSTRAVSTSSTALASRAGDVLAAPTGAAATTRPHADVITPLAISVIAPPQPVRGADGRVHLEYELVLFNQTPSAVTIAAVEALDPGRGNAVVATLRGARLAALLLLLAGVSPLDGPAELTGSHGTTLGPGHAGYVFMDVTLATGAPVPRALTHRFSLRVRAASGTAAPRPLTFVGVPMPVRARPAVVLAPPLEGPGWVADSGCCFPLTHHRAGALAINGTLYVSERFAIDFVQLNANDRLYTGDATKLASYAFYGARIHAVADGVVVGTQDGFPDQVPAKAKALPPVTAQNAAGNYVVEALGQGRFAMYAHLQPGSLRVKPGERVRRGQVLALLGNSGNSVAPHLHFQVMDGPSPLLSNGLPYVFTSFHGQGVVTSEDALVKGAVVPIDRSAMSGPHHDELPLNLEVVSFPRST